MEQIYSFAVVENELQKLKYNSFLGNFCNSKGLKKIKKKKKPQVDQKIELFDIRDTPTLL